MIAVIAPAKARASSESYGRPRIISTVPMIGVTETEGAEVVREPGDLLARELRHEHADLEHDRPEPDRVAVRLDIDLAGVDIDELEQVQAGQIAGRVVEEHVFRAGIAGVDAAGFGAGVPLVDGGVVLHARIGALPGGVGDLLPEIAGLDRLGDLAVGAADQIPVAVVLRPP